MALGPTSNPNQCTASSTHCTAEAAGFREGKFRHLPQRRKFSHEIAPPHPPFRALQGW